MRITVNGKALQIEPRTRLSTLLQELQLDPQAVVVEHNMNIVSKQNLAAVELKDNDTLEILRFVGGG